MDESNNTTPGDLTQRCVIGVDMAEGVDATVARHNANLIAAAPDMYNLLQEIADNIGYLAETDEDGNATEKTLGDTINSLLARARGEV